MQTVLQYPLYQLISFWVAVGMLLNFSGNFFYMMLILEYEDKETLIQMKVIYSIVSIIKDVVMSLALLGKEPEDNVSSNDFILPENLDLDEFNPTNLKNDQL